MCLRGVGCAAQNAKPIKDGELLKLMKAVATSSDSPSTIVDHTYQIPPPLVLHFDINGTIIQFDEAGGKTMEQVLATNIGQMAFGRVIPQERRDTDNEEGVEFQLLIGPDGKPISQQAADLLASGTVPQQCGQQRCPKALRDKNSEEYLISHSMYIDTVMHPMPDCLRPTSAGANKRDTSSQAQCISQDERLKIMKELRRKRQHEYYKLLTKEGKGHCLLPFMEEQEKCLRLSEETEDGDHRNGKVFIPHRNKGPSEYHSKASHWYIIPAFFNLINELSELNWPFYLFFRTFGSDLINIIEEWKMFVLGEHVMKPKGPILEQMRKEWADPLFGTIYRDDGGIFLTWGPSKSCPVPPVISGSSPSSSTAVSSISATLEYLHSIPGYQGAKHVPPCHNLFEELRKETYEKSNCVCGIVDYFPYWAAHGENKHTGKLGPTTHLSLKGEVTKSNDYNGKDKEGVGSLLPQKSNYFHLFFDDNIYLYDEDDESIFDFRDAVGNPVDDDIAYLYGVKVIPYHAITDPQYFIRMLMEKVRLQIDVLREVLT